MEIKAYNLYNALAFDSIYQVLSWYDRTSIHLFLNGKIPPDEITPKAEDLAIIIAENDIEAPEMRYGQDRLLYYKQEYLENPIEDFPPEWLPVEKYKAYHPEITEQILKLT